MKRLRVLLLEDNEMDAELSMRALEDAGYECGVERVCTRAEFEGKLEHPSYDMVLADYNLPGFDGMSALKLFRARQLQMPFIFVSGTMGEERAIETLKAGATDYVLKTHISRLAPVVARALREQDDQNARRQAEAAQQQEAAIAAALAIVGRTLIASLDAPELLKRLCEVAAEVLSADFAHTLLKREPDGHFVPVQACGDSAERWEELRAVHLPPDVLAPVLGALQSADAAVVEPTSGQSPMGLRPAHQLENEICVALRRGPSIMGLLAVGRHGPRPFNESELRIAAGVSQLASLALANAHAIEELARVSQLKSDFVATMSHELRTPLNAIMGYNDLLMDGEFGPLSPESRPILERVKSSATELLDLVNATLDLGRLESGRLPLVISQVDLDALLEEFVAEAKERFTRKRDLTLVLVSKAGLPRVQSDAAKLKVILKNIIDNAAKFSERGTIRLSAAPANDGVEIVVADPGIGIAPAIMPIIFEPFRQGETSATRRYGGVGLGLYIVRRLLDALSGKVTIESEPQRGTTVRVWIPRSIEAGRYMQV